MPFEDRDLGDTNPDAKIDWWVIGGRWDGAMRGLAHGGGDDALEWNSCLVEEIDPSFIPFAFLSPDGLWFEKGQLLWFGQAADEEEPDKWRMKWGEARGAFVGHTAVLVDFHGA